MHGSCQHLLITKTAHLIPHNTSIIKKIESRFNKSGIEYNGKTRARVHFISPKSLQNFVGEREYNRFFRDTEIIKVTKESPFIPCSRIYFAERTQRNTREPHPPFHIGTSPSNATRLPLRGIYRRISLSSRARRIAVHRCRAIAATHIGCTNAKIAYSKRLYKARGVRSILESAWRSSVDKRR